MRFHLTCTRMVIIKGTDNNKCCKDVKKLEPTYIAYGNVKWEKSVAVPQKIKQSYRKTQ